MHHLQPLRIVLALHSKVVESSGLVHHVLLQNVLFVHLLQELARGQHHRPAARLRGGPGGLGPEALRVLSHLRVQVLSELSGVLANLEGRHGVVGVGGRAQAPATQLSIHAPSLAPLLSPLGPGQDLVQPRPHLVPDGLRLVLQRALGDPVGRHHVCRDLPQYSLEGRPLLASKGGQVVGHFRGHSGHLWLGLLPVQHRRPVRQVVDLTDPLSVSELRIPDQPTRRRHQPGVPLVLRRRDPLPDRRHHRPLARDHRHVPRRLLPPLHPPVGDAHGRVPP
mmetsp:Transcript_129095/g.294620  ORF Transcript_129095/g.294620 Transcript_129095/m.294620 type:complete len:279 (+) Transcript_129095:196-1032(+)